MKKTVFVIIALNISFSSLTSQISPSSDYREIFEEVQKSQLFSDQKTFVDCIPKFPVDTIKNKYNEGKNKKDFDLNHFIIENFKLSITDTAAILNHIDLLWDYLTKQPVEQDSLSSLIALPYAYVIPGGRFREIYYWDSYFTMLGLLEAGKTDMIENMVNNFSFLIERYGHIPNGNRTYYLSRSQPPFFSLMLTLLAECKGESIYSKYLSTLKKEYEFWMNGEDQLSENKSAVQRVVQLEKGAILNRYWDNLCQPRPESYLDDIETFESSDRDSAIFRDIRAAAESGWDFSSRWLGDKNVSSSIETTKIIPVDLNSLLYHYELTLSKAYKLVGDESKAVEFTTRAGNRKEWLIKYCWNQDSAYFYDYNFVTGKNTSRESLAGVFPLFFSMTDSTVAHQVCLRIKDNYLAEGGLVTTLDSTGQQWDYPNGWAPLQWIGYKACKNYSCDSLAHEIAIRWTNLNIKVFFESGKMLEKYNVIDINTVGGGGEYELQDGFGWTNGVFLKLWNEEIEDNSLLENSQ